MYNVNDTNAYLRHASHTMPTLADLRTATLNARIRTGDRRIAVTVKAGKYQGQHVTPKKGTADVKRITEWLSLSEVIAWLDSL